MGPQCKPGEAPSLCVHITEAQDALSTLLVTFCYFTECHSASGVRRPPVAGCRNIFDLIFTLKMVRVGDLQSTSGINTSAIRWSPATPLSSTPSGEPQTT